MAGGNYNREPSGALPFEVNANIPARATRRLQKANTEEINTKTAYGARHSFPRGQVALSSSSPRLVKLIGLAKLSLLPQQRLWIIGLVCSVLLLSVLLSAAINLRPHGPDLLSFS